MTHGQPYTARLTRLVQALVLPGLLLAAYACEPAPESNSRTALCDYYADWLDIAFQLQAPQGDSFDALLASGDLRRIEEEAGAGYERLETFLDRFGDLAPPAEARLWHASVEDTASGLQGFFALLEGAARQRDPDDVAMVLDRLQFGLLVEVDQLGRQGEELFRPCMER